MFGGRKKRGEKLSAGAAENLESGESIRELVQTQTHADRLYEYVGAASSAADIA